MLSSIFSILNHFSTSLTKPAFQSPRKILPLHRQASNQITKLANVLLFCIFHILHKTRFLWPISRFSRPKCPSDEGAGQRQNICPTKTQLDFLPHRQDSHQRRPPRTRQLRSTVEILSIYRLLVPRCVLSVSIPICQVFQSQCMECVPLMPWNAWHDRGADGTSQVRWQLTFLSISHLPSFLSLPCFPPPTPTPRWRWEKDICLNQEECLQVACPPAAACQWWARGKTTYFSFSAFFPFSALLNAHSCQLWYGTCCCSLGNQHLFAFSSTCILSGWPCSLCKSRQLMFVIGGFMRPYSTSAASRLGPCFHQGKTKSCNLQC